MNAFLGRVATTAKSFRGTPLPEGWVLHQGTVLVKDVGGPQPSTRIAAVRIG